MKNIKLIRVINDYTQLKVQMETGINQSILSKYENAGLIRSENEWIRLTERGVELSNLVLADFLSA